MTSHKTRRKFLALIGAGTAGLAGCSAIGDDNPTNGGNTTDNDNTSTPEGTGDTDIPQFSPDQSRYVEDGQLSVRPFVEVFGFRSITSNSVGVIMTAMPNPVADYEVNVHYTPLSAVETEWKINTVRNPIYGGITPEYNSETSNWESNGGGTVTTIREAKENGVQIGTIEIPSESAGLIAEDVANPYKEEDINVEYNEDDEIEFVSSESRRRFETWVENRIPALGQSYTDYVQSVIDDTPPLRSQFQFNTGSWLSGTGPLVPPFTKEVEFSLTDDQISELGLTRHRDSGFPEQEPFVLTFTINDPNSQYNDPSKIVTQTPTAVPSPDESSSLYTPDVRVPENSTETWLQKNWTRGITNQDEWEEVGLDEYYQDVDYSDSEDVTDVKISRLTNYGRYSPKMERYSQRMLESSTAQTRAPEQFLATEPYAYLDSPIQSAWNISYEVDFDTIPEAQRRASQIKSSYGRSEKYEELASEAQNYDVIQNVIQQLRDVCDNIGTETPTEEVRVVADFVSNLTHIALDDDPPEGALEGFGTQGPQHPVWTLYNQTGDCQDFTVLANTILSSDEFGYNPSVAVADSLAFSRDGSPVTHVSTSLPMSDLEIDDVQDDALIEFITEGRVAIQEDVQYTYSGEKYAYVEMSAPFPIGTTYGRRTLTASPDPLETWSW